MGTIRDAFADYDQQGGIGPLSHRQRPQAPANCLGSFHSLCEGLRPKGPPGEPTPGVSSSVPARGGTTPRTELRHRGGHVHVGGYRAWNPDRPNHGHPARRLSLLTPTLPSSEHLFDTGRVEYVKPPPPWEAGRQGILNDLEAQKPQHTFRQPVPVVVRIVWEHDGEEHIDTVALGWTGQRAYIRLPDPRYRFTAVWLRAEDVKRRSRQP